MTEESSRDRQSGTEEYRDRQGQTKRQTDGQSGTESRDGQGVYIVGHSETNTY